MRVILITIACFYTLACSAQGDSTSNLTYKQWADSIYGGLAPYVPTGFLYNRILNTDTTDSFSWNTDSVRINTANGGALADHMYGLLYEQHLMAFDSSQVLDRMQLFEPVSAEMVESEFEYEELYYPIGIFDYRFEFMDEAANLSAGNIIKVGDRYEMTGNSLDLSVRKATLVGPLFDLFDSERMALVFRKKYFLSNYRDSNDVASIKLTHDGQIHQLNWDQLYYFVPLDSAIQTFEVEVIYNDSSKIKCLFSINTPELGLKINTRGDFPGCLLQGEERINSLPIPMKLQWCLIGRCGFNGRVLKPYVLLTGYRPPLFGQPFKKTWKIYSSNHNALLQSLIDNNYDIFLVKFNIHWTPYSQGMVESAELLEKFLLTLNEFKGLEGQENIIQGSSMSADIARLTLLRMEKKHFEDQTYPHHHTRLFINYDANFYGANIPLAYQYEIYSHFNFPHLVNTPLIGNFASVFLYATMQQKTVKELLMYHATATDHNVMGTAQYVRNLEPKMHSARLSYYASLEAVDNNVHIFPMPIYTRNIAISLGKISNTNDYLNPFFLGAGLYWRDFTIGFTQIKIGTAKYMTNNENFLLFRRKKLLFPPVKHEMNVTNMLEIDNSSGSYLAGTGNIAEVVDIAFFPIQASANPPKLFSHKPVVTALGINPNLWPSDGSMTLNIQNLGLMYNQLNFNPNIPSDHFGYPNLGRPDDHFQVTPFEAIYVDKRLNPHIILTDDDPTDLNALNDFIRNEVEPWYLGLQNQTVGAQARPNYIYYSYRRAKHEIIVGNLVTPTTDPGDFVVNPNGKLTLKAGDKIVLKPGTTFKKGSLVYIKPEYEQCNNQKSAEAYSWEDNDENDGYLNNSLDEQRTFLVFPNPASTQFRIQLLHEVLPESIELRNFFGEIIGVFPTESIRNYFDISHLESGIYFVTCNFPDQKETSKLMILR